jgi:hypothetical protein
MCLLHGTAIARPLFWNRKEKTVKRIIAVFLVLVVGVLAGCGLVSSTGSGNVVTHEESITGFDEVDISQGFTVDISQGDTFSVVVRVDDNLIQYLQVVKEDSTLKIGLDLDRIYVNATLQAEVTMPELSRVTLKEGSHATVSGSGGDFTIEASEGSGGDLSAFAVQSATAVATGGSQLTVNVSGKLVADASEGSKIYYLGSPTEVTTNSTSGAEILPR